MACKTSCSFFAYAGSRLFDANDRPELGAEYQYLVLMDDISGPRRTVIAYSYSAGNVFLRSVWNKKWQTDDWFPLATRKSPEVHELPLASGFPAQSYANTYYKTQEGIVHLNFCIFRGASTAFVEPETICTMPEGYRPSSVIAAAVGGDGKSLGNGLPSAELHIEPDGRMWFYGADTRINWIYGEITFLAAS